jgi:3-oxoacyl-[acyl-carrier protein] reductase
MNLSLIGKHALVGGASAGIGKAVAYELASLGATVTIMSRTEAQLQACLASLPTEHGQTHSYLVVDYAKATEMQSIVLAHVEVHPVHILINNAGGPPAGPIATATPDAFLAALNNHLICNHLLAQAVIPSMKAAKFGRIVNIISTSVKEPLENLGVSNSTRGAVASWAKTLAGELGPFNITVNNVLPGYTSTDRLEDIINKRMAVLGVSREELIAQFQAHVPLRRFAQAEEIAAAVAFLASPAASYISGINVPVDGGRTRSL